MNLRFLLPFLLASASYAGSVITATCDAIVGDGHCRSEIPAGYGSTSGSSALGSVTLSLASNSADWSTLSTYQTALSRQGYPFSQDSTIGPGTSASVSIQYSQSVITAGPERSGFLQIQGSGYGGYFYDGNAGITSGFTISPYTGRYDGSPVTQIYCEANSSLCSPGPGYYSNYNFIPVTLGTPLVLVADGHLTNQAVFQDGISGGSLTTTFQFRFFEADRATSVGVVTVTAAPEITAPEPSTWGLFGLSLAGGALLRRKLTSLPNGAQA